MGRYAPGCSSIPVGCQSCTNAPAYAYYTGTSTTNNCAWACNGGAVLSGGVCVQCPSGSYAAQGDKACTQCFPGTYAPSAGASACARACPGGQYYEPARAGCIATTGQCGAGYGATQAWVSGSTPSGVVATLPPLARSDMFMCPSFAAPFPCSLTQYYVGAGLGCCATLGAATPAQTVLIGGNDPMVASAGFVSGSLLQLRGSGYAVYVGMDAFGMTVFSLGSAGPVKNGPGIMWSTCPPYSLPAGRYFWNPDANDYTHVAVCYMFCQLCSPGQYAPGGGATCLPCPPGQYSGAAGLSGCTKCLAGTVPTVAGGGATACRPCPAGTYSAYDGEDVCTPCAAGSFQGAAQGTGCTACASGWAAAARGMSACVLCPAGTFVAATQACTRCAPGYFASAAGQTACIACPAGTYAPLAGSNACAPKCPAGQYYEAARGACIAPTQCTAGYGSTQALVPGSLPPGVTSDALPPSLMTGASVLCQPQTPFACGIHVFGSTLYAVLGCCALLGAVASDVGVSMVNGSQSAPFVAGSVTAVRGSGAAYSGLDAGGATVFLLGTWGALHGVPAASTCPPYSLVTGILTTTASHVAVCYAFCQLCAPGQYAPGGGAACLPCPTNTYAAAAGSSACTPCPVGRFTGTAGGATACALPAPPCPQLLCPPDSYCG